MNHYTRQTLLQKIKDTHSEDSWNEFVEIYRPYIYHVIKTFGVKTDEIEDFVQNTLIICWKKLPGFNYEPDKGRFRYWLSRIAQYSVNNHIRKFNRRAELDEEIIIPTSLSPEIEEISDKEWKVFISKMAWDNIKDNLSEIARLSFSALMDGESMDSISERLAIPKNTISVNKKRISPKMFKEIQRLQRELG
ncbi:probable extracytoplasmic function alternative sigma factor [Lentisphaera araneosa HTCC2155]|jgi:RNA polymerase sigma factor (sigma-70 family)|uniref:Probable extracytoplasmic function alternative sigma factor n=1 Tax=Lentisphaera araneosa HTCC2155 TaxID=313628 RepID=A6DMS2_9BACT|nr:sigma-70 family RNA polymerase sigma factor [Lentisphaera araneosa]EDM26958.1 probable extracytoplasmic function alternative sigma factor [Lentisphaera araneosa HTCC2155]